jgi:plasmid maintenance system antidote protein VapI
MFPMTLLEYLKEAGGTVDKGIAQLAMQVGRHEGSIKKIAYGQRSASVELALEIERVSGGSVNAATLNQSVGTVRDAA